MLIVAIQVHLVQALLESGHLSDLLSEHDLLLVGKLSLLLLSNLLNDLPAHAHLLEMRTSYFHRALPAVGRLWAA